MIAHAGLLSWRMGFETPLAETACTQRYVSRFLYVRDSAKDLIP